MNKVAVLRIVQVRVRAPSCKCLEPPGHTLPQTNDLVEDIELLSRHASLCSNSGREPDVVIERQLAAFCFFIPAQRTDFLTTFHRRPDQPCRESLLQVFVANVCVQRTIHDSHNGGRLRTRQCK
jgi:hypothetical protein